jgi:hypothetical protein
VIVGCTGDTLSLKNASGFIASAEWYWTGSAWHLLNRELVP